MYTKPDELAGLMKDAAEKANDRLRTGLFTFALVSAFLGIAVLSTTDRDLLMGKTLSLPVVEVDLPLTWFYFLAPLVYLMLHLALLTQAVQTVQRLARFAAELRLTDRERVPEPGHRWAVWVAAPLSLVRHPGDGGPQILGRLRSRLLGALPFTVVPLGLLFAFHQRFLAYQYWPVTLVHLAVIVADALAIAYAWRRLKPELLEIAGVEAGTAAGLARSLVVVPYAAVAVAVVWCVTVSVRPAFLGQWHLIDLRGGSAVGDADARRTGAVASIDGETLAKRLSFMRTGNLTTLADPAAETDALIRKEVLSVKRGPDLRGRSLRKARLVQADLAGADLTGADLTGADLRFADLRGAVLDGADLSEADLGHARLHRADLTRTALRKVRAPFGALPGAVVHAADFTGADLRGAHLEFLRHDDPGTTSDGIAAGKRGAIFYDANLTGAQLHGTDLGALDIRYAQLRDAQLHGALRLPAPGEIPEGAILSGAVVRHEQEAEDGKPRRRFFVVDSGGKPVADLCKGEPPNFSSVFYDAALIATEETWVPIMKVVMMLREAQVEPCEEPAAGAATAELARP